MRRLLVSTLACTLLLSSGLVFAQDEKPAEEKETPSPFKTLKEEASYTIGQNLAAQIKFNDEIELDFDVVIQGFVDKLQDKEPKLTERQQQEAMLALRQQLQEAAMKRQEEKDEAMKKQFAKQIESDKAFLSKNAKREGVKTTESGLQYEVMKEGEGKVSPKATDTVTTHYHGTLIDGTVFDSSVERGKPIDFPVNGVIKGWTEALQLMQVGDKFKLYLPYDLAYGNRSMSDKIGPYSTLIFEVELLAINGEK